MHLLHVRTHVLETFFEPQIPKYIILSHRWEDDEVLFSDIATNEYHHRKGYKKLMLVCERAIESEIDYVWIDTCCIDKSSSAELSEAINSMFQFYRGSEFCYTYLSDIDHASESLSITQSEWFGRGWTLQELIAPRRVVFYNQDGLELGDRNTRFRQINERTQVDTSLLLHQANVDGLFTDFTAAQKISWAAGRKTTRIEDRAYSLLGIFGVNMPLLYGEGTQAFVRLQEEILRTGTDLSILAWSLMDDEWQSPRHDLLAESPDDFTGCHDIVHSFPAPGWEFENSSFAMTNKGLQVDRPPIVTFSDPGGTKNFALALGCTRRSDTCDVLALKVRTTSATSTEHSTESRSKTCYIGWRSHKIGHDIRLIRTIYFEPVLLPDWPMLTIAKRQPPTKPLPNSAAGLSHPDRNVWIFLPKFDRSSTWKVLSVQPNWGWFSEAQAYSLDSLIRRRPEASALVIGNQLGESFAMYLRPDKIRDSIQFALAAFNTKVELSGGQHKILLRSEVVKLADKSYQTQMDKMEISTSCRVVVFARHLVRSGKTIHQLQIEVERERIAPYQPPCEVDTSGAIVLAPTRAINSDTCELPANEIGPTKLAMNLQHQQRQIQQWPRVIAEWRTDKCVADWVKTADLATEQPNINSQLRFHGYTDIYNHPAAD